MMAQEHTDIEAVYARLEAAERELAQIRTHHVQTLNTLGKTYSNLLTAVDTLSRFKVEYEAVQDDLNAARTASTLADIHHSTSRLVLIEVKELLAKEATLDPQWVASLASQKAFILQQVRGLLGEVAGLTLERRANELLSGDDLTPSKTEQLASLAKAYEYFVVEYFTAKDSKAEAARDMLTAQYNRLLGEVTA